MTLAKKHIDNTWDFRTANTKEYTHCYHNYPAMMIPQIASRLITEYGRGAKTLFDPYCGTGTSLVEANINGIDAYGTDLNPMAQLIAKAKTSKIELQILDLYLKEFNDYLFALNFGIKKLNIIVPTFKNIDFWFKEETKNTLAIIKQFIDNIKDKKVQRFFLVAFSETIRESSLTRNSEFKLYRMSEKQRENFNPDVFGMINLKLVRNRIGLKNYIKKNQNSVNAHIYNFNSSENMNEIQKNPCTVQNLAINLLDEAEDKSDYRATPYALDLSENLGSIKCISKITKFSAINGQIDIYYGTSPKLYNLISVIFFLISWWIRKYIYKVKFFLPPPQTSMFNSIFLSKLMELMIAL